MPKEAAKRPSRQLWVCEASTCCLRLKLDQLKLRQMTIMHIWASGLRRRNLRRDSMINLSWAQSSFSRVLAGWLDSLQEKIIQLQPPNSEQERELRFFCVHMENSYSVASLLFFSTARGFSFAITRWLGDAKPMEIIVGNAQIWKRSYISRQCGAEAETWDD